MPSDALYNSWGLVMGTCSIEDPKVPGETTECPAWHSKDKENHLVSYITLPWWEPFLEKQALSFFFFFRCQSDDLSRSISLIKFVSLFSTFSAVFIRDEVCHGGFVCNKIILVKPKYRIIHTLSLLLRTFFLTKKPKL